MRGKGGRNRGVACVLVGLVAGMAGLAYASVPLYRLFCQVTGFGGTPRQAQASPVAVGERVIAVRFNADVNSRLPWRVAPLAREVEVRVGETALAFYRAENLAAGTVTGTATFNVTPAKAGRYFAKIDCFCFTEQTLGPGESARLPVSFYVDPGIAADPATRDVSTITLSYAFFTLEAERAASSAGEGGVRIAGSPARVRE